MKNLLLTSLTMTTICSFNALSSQESLTFLDDNPDAFILSEDGQTCHGPLSKERMEIAQQDGSKPFATSSECLRKTGANLTTEELVLRQQKDNQETAFYGINWGLALAFVHMDQPRINDLSDIKIADDQTLFVKHQSKNRAIAMLESHYFFKTKWNVFDTEFGHGPFLAIGITGDEGIDPLSTYGFGYMWGFKRDVKDNPTNTSWNIGVGMFVDTDVKQLRPQYSDGDMVSTTDLDALTFNRDETGLMVIFSATF